MKDRNGRTIVSPLDRPDGTGVQLQAVIRLPVRNCEDCGHFTWSIGTPGAHFVAGCKKGRRMPHFRKPRSPLDEQFGFRTRCAEWVEGQLDEGDVRAT